MAQEHEGCSLHRDRLLEADILAIIWERKQATVRDVYETLREQRQIAYTTVMTVMNNLVKKELLTQDRTAIAYVYTPAIPGNEVASTILDSVVQRAVPRPGQPRALAPARAEGDLDPEQAEELRKYAAHHICRPNCLVRRNQQKVFDPMLSSRDGYIVGAENVVFDGLKHMILHEWNMFVGCGMINHIRSVELKDLVQAVTILYASNLGVKRNVRKRLTHFTVDLE